ncbi:hypothetical protein APY94_02920 [Thermococcus celericrescens]|uniref:Uncharacterized protein n=1 Tax=Thermococcus celericrescens TaxID=227598 RepID=A0A100XZ60_9EURY|nr:hypothetical protein [Thermococcus celericrescens]KUH34242.1 hypothetical protein APY94_02920 [Thermococcus celericrescens]
MTNDGDRRNLITTNREIRRVRRQTISAIFNQLHGFTAHEEFSDLVQEAKEKYGITRIGVFDVDMLIWDFKNGLPIALLEVKNRHQLQEDDGYAIFDELQYTFLEDLGSYLGVPVFYVVKTRVKWLVWKVERDLAVRRKLADGRKIVLLPLDKAERYNHGEMVHRFLKKLMER